MIFVLNPRVSNEEAARVIRRGKMSLSRDEGEMRAMVSPRFKAGGKMPASVWGREDILRLEYKID